MLSGFLCPHSGNKVNFDFCHSVCRPKCRPLPLLLALAREGWVKEGVYSVTELPQPPQVVYLKRNFTYYSSPDDFALMMFGTAIHFLIESQQEKLQELGCSDDYIQEGSFETIFDELPGIKLRGRADLYQKSTKTLWDFKRMKFFYDAKKILVDRIPVEIAKPDMVFQINAYKTFKFPDAEKLQVECMIGDYSRKIKKMYGISAIENFDIPIWPAEKTRKMTLDYLRVHLDVQSTGKPRPCMDEERWYNIKAREYVRCLDFCPVNDICPQYQQEQEDKRR